MIVRETFPIKILSYWDQRAKNWMSLHEQSWFWSARLGLKRWLTSQWTDTIKSIFDKSTSSYQVEFEAYQSNKDGYYLIFYGASTQVYENQGMAFLTPDIIKKCNQGSIKLLIVFCHETWDKRSPFKEWYWGFCGILSELGLTKSHSVVILTGTDLATRPHPDNRCDVIYYPWFEANLQISMRSQGMTSQPMNFDRKTKRFINLNRVIRPHRFLMLAYLKYKNLDQHGYLSWKNPNCLSWKQILNYTGSTDRDFTWTTQLTNFDRERFGFFHYVNSLHVLDNIDLDDVEDPNKTVQDSESTNNPETQWLGADAFYLDSWADLVSETHFELYGDIFPTEKTFKPLAYGMPFIFNASRNHLHHVKKLGYQTFPEIFDESYDAMPGNLLKIAAIGNQIDLLCVDDKKINILKSPEVQAKIEYNQNQFWNKDHGEQLGKLLYEAWIKGRA
jgi:hypothetical protein